MIYIFDIDGTICAPRQHMEKDFIETFRNFCLLNQVVLVTGSTKELILEQVPNSILQLVTLYTCSGVEGISFDIDYDIKDTKLIDSLNVELNLSFYPEKVGNHICRRKGMINFSVVGRNANNEQREEYSKYDKINKERYFIVERLKKRFIYYDFLIGGETSIDITKKGINKSLVARDLCLRYKDPKMVFIANAIIDGGNDYPLAKYIKDNNLGMSIQVDYPMLKEHFYMLNNF